SYCTVLYISISSSVDFLRVRCTVLFCSVLFCSVLFCSVLFYFFSNEIQYVYIVNSNNNDELFQIIEIYI
ncbi:MAG: hypothetical protein ACI90V_005429, partial [Bacillariaceae sp.]